MHISVSWWEAGLASQRASLTLVWIPPPHLRLLVMRMALSTARYSTSFPYLKAECLGTLIYLCCNSHLSCDCPFRLLKQKHHKPGGSFFAHCFLTEGWLLYRISWFSVIEKQESSMGSPMPPPFRNIVPFPSPSHPSSWSQSPCLSSLSHTANSCWLSILHVVL